MILDSLVNFHLHAAPGTRLHRAFEYLRDFDPATPDGRVEVDGDNVFALVQGYDTRPMGKCRFEAHKKYIDIQYVSSGGEIMGWRPARDLDVAEEYDEERDIVFFEQPSTFTPCEVTAGLFTVFFPHDAHEPGIRMLGHSNVRKVVMKVRI
ncbi:YhcH/YjgK/YiaL family protein [Candidatus Sumerlaeota bacterium]|nr:YhcH/YjgK/YiaL family protein [Candidatus Sumerlaeota bacterium]